MANSGVSTPSAGASLSCEHCPLVSTRALGLPHLPPGENEDFMCECFVLFPSSEHFPLTFTRHLSALGAVMFIFKKTLISTILIILLTVIKYNSCALFRKGMIIIISLMTGSV